MLVWLFEYTNSNSLWKFFTSFKSWHIIFFKAYFELSYLFLTKYIFPKEPSPIGSKYSKSSVSNSGINPSFDIKFNFSGFVKILKFIFEVSLVIDKSPFDDELSFLSLKFKLFKSFEFFFWYFKLLLICLLKPKLK